ncbi:hypothetical protein Gotri_008747, partial [Gossypium trilobum]|nr:hypothetical protein [Gossypium trilobum]
MHEIKKQYAVFDAKVLRFQGDPLKEKNRFTGQDVLSDVHLVADFKL